MKIISILFRRDKIHYISREASLSAIRFNPRELLVRYHCRYIVPRAPHLSYHLYQTQNKKKTKKREEEDRSM